MATIRDVANYFLSTQNPESDITNLKLQKLCAYAQAMSLALLNRPIFQEPLEAWQHGPVEPSLYNQYEQYGRSPLPSPGLSEHFARQPFDDEQKYILELVANYYGQYSAWNLRERSHRDFPGMFGSKQVIAHESIRDAFASDSLVIKLRENLCHAEQCPSEDRLVSEQEVMDALAV